MSDVADRYRAALDEADRQVQAIGPDQWTNATPCSAWDVRALVDHLVYESLWVPDLVRGATLAEVGSRYEGDRLGTDPLAAWGSARSAAADAVASGPLDVPVHTSGGELTADEYLTQMLFDASIHAWDVAQGIGASHTIRADVAVDLYAWFEPQARGWVQAGILAPAVPVSGDADPSDRLIALSGRDPGRPFG
jgi:uncharacterized protein (TIGR03086 family)